MQDLYLHNGDLVISEGDAQFIDDAEALKEQLLVFLSTEAAYSTKEGIITRFGELDYDQNNGINFTFIFDKNTTNSEIIDHYRQQILKYYSDFIREITDIQLTKDFSTRKMYLNFKYKTIWSNSEEEVAINV